MVAGIFGGAAYTAMEEQRRRMEADRRRAESVCEPTDDGQYGLSSLGDEMEEDE